MTIVLLISFLRTIIISLELLAGNNLPIMDETSPSRACRTVGRLVGNSLNVINITMKVVEAFVTFLTNMGQNIAKLSIESLTYWVGLNQVIKMGELNYLSQKWPHLRCHNHQTVL